MTGERPAKDNNGLEARLSAEQTDTGTDDSMRRALELQQRIDRRIAGLFAPPESPASLPDREGRNGRPDRTEPERRRGLPSSKTIGKRWLVAAAIVLLTFGGLQIYLMTMRNMLGMTGGHPVQSLTEQHRTLVDHGFEPAFVCESDEEFAQAAEEYIGEPVIVASSNAAASGVDVIGWVSPPGTRYGRPPSPLVLLTRVEGDPVTVWMGRNTDAPSRVRSGGGLRVFRRELEGLTFIEITPRKSPGVLDLFEINEPGG